ncbi:NAD(P)/FAD-dependent oxidoreductase [Nocardioides panacisoli]|uniref:dihydrolipoyl dehydrogenase family protein n=1 Tax=Nocardioides panacisoli TaxID=627624 RepID=UPI001C625FB5|nr:NAD(P)/FAD-dependent oxidoreductase [Nocardioides panacisoli]QYJ05696.1 NAD(P)/FAD-dependent oxidoreductase [Nocardioides panacisoli]
MNQQRHTEVIVVGLGVGGESVAGSLAAAGVDVVGIEAELVGGECPYWACIPTKMMVRAADLLAETRRVPGTAGTVDGVHPDWAPVARRIREKATTGWDDTIAVDRLTDAGVHFVRGRARILAPDRVEVDGVEFTASRGLVVATGTTASAPPIPGLAGTPYWTNREAISTEQLPRSLAVIGAGVVGCEIGQVHARFGVAVTVLESAPRPLPAEDADAGELLAERLREDGVDLRLGVSVTGVEHRDGFTVHLDGAEPVHAEQLLVATGRRPAIDADTWVALGLEGDPGSLPTDDHLRVRDGVWAVGDVTGRGAFTHVATYQADLVVADLLGRGAGDAEYHALPRVAFTDPEVGGVGLTEQQARDAGIDVAVGRADVAATTRGWLHGEGNAGLIKLVADRENDRLVGAVSVGPTGGEVLGALAVAVHARVPLATLAGMIWAYPTFHRGIQDALRDLRADAG